MKDELPTDIRDLNSKQGEPERCPIVLASDEVGGGGDFPSLLDVLAFL